MRRFVFAVVRTLADSALDEVQNFDFVNVPTNLHRTIWTLIYELHLVVHLFETRVAQKNFVLPKIVLHLQCK